MQKKECEDGINVFKFIFSNNSYLLVFVKPIKLVEFGLSLFFDFIVNGIVTENLVLELWSEREIGELGYHEPSNSDCAGNRGKHLPREM